MPDSDPTIDQNKSGSHDQSSGKYFFWYDAEYLGGHSMYPNRCYCTLSLYPREMVIKQLDLHVPYSSIKEVKNVNEHHMKALRVIAFGVVGALWKKKETYLSILYNDGIQDQNPILKVEGLEKAQKRLYEHVVQAKQQQK